MAAWACQPQACLRINKDETEPANQGHNRKHRDALDRRRQYSLNLRTLTHVWSKHEQNHPETDGYRRRATEQNPGNNRQRRHILV